MAYLPIFIKCFRPGEVTAKKAKANDLEPIQKDLKPALKDLEPIQKDLKPALKDLKTVRRT